MDERRLLTEDQAFELLAFLIASCETSLIEPAFYGPRRLLEAAERLSQAMLEGSDMDGETWLNAFAGEVEVEKNAVRRQPERFQDFVRRSSAGIAGELVRRSAITDNGGVDRSPSG